MPWGQPQPQYGQQSEGFGQGFGGGMQNAPEYETVPRPNQKYCIALAVAPHMVMDSSGNPMERRKCILYNRNYGENQKWVFVPSHNGSFMIINCQDRGTLEIPDNSQGQQGTQVHVAQPSNTINEAWYVRPQGQGVGFFAAFNEQMGLNVGGGQLVNEADIIIWPFSGEQNEIWVLIPCND